MRRFLLLLALVGCADRGGLALAPSPDAGAAAPVDELLALVPADAAYVIAVRAPMPAAVRQRLAWDVGPFVARLASVAAQRLDDDTIEDPVARVEAALLGELPGPIDADTQIVVHELHGVPVLRVEVTDAAALEAAVVRAWARAKVTAAPVIEGEHGAIAVARDGRILTVAIGPTAAVQEILPLVAGVVPLDTAPIDPASLTGLGFVDLGAMAGSVLDSPELAAWLASGAAPSACQAATMDMLTNARAHLPRIVLRAASGDVAQVEVSAELALDPALAAAFAAPAVITPGIPATFPGKPIVGFSFASPQSVTDDQLSNAWIHAIARVTSACGTGVKPAVIPSDGDVRGLAFAFYDITKADGWFPTDAQAYLAVVARDPVALLHDAADTLPFLRGQEPTDGAPMTRIAAQALAPFVSVAAIARRGGTLILAAGAQGQTYATEALAAAEPAPILHLFLDVARIAGSGVEASGGGGMSDEAGFGALVTRLISTLDVTVVNTPVPALRVAATLTPPAFPPAAARLDPTHVTETTCRRLLARSWTSWSRTLSRLGVTDLDRYERRLLDAPGFLDGCAALTDAARACLRAAPDVLAAVGRCDAYGLSLPDLFEDEDAMNAVLGVNAPTLAQLAGTWVSVTDPHDRWTIDASGRASDGSSRMKLTIVSDGALDVGGYPAGFVLDGSDDLYLAQGDRAFPLRDEQHVVAVTNLWDDDDWLVLDPRGCVTIGDDGQLLEEICQFVDRGGARWFDAGSASYLELAGHLVPPDVAAAHYHRAP